MLNSPNSFHPFLSKANVFATFLSASSAAQLAISVLKDQIIDEDQT